MGRCFVLFPEDRVRGCRLLSAPKPCQHVDPCLLRPQGRGGGTGASPPPPPGPGGSCPFSTAPLPPAPPAPEEGVVVLLRADPQPSPAAQIV